MAQNEPFHEILDLGLLQPQGELYPSQPIFNRRIRDQLLKLGISIYETISSFLSKVISSTLNFLKSIDTDGTQTRKSRIENEHRINWANLTELYLSTKEKNTDHSLTQKLNCR